MNNISIGLPIKSLERRVSAIAAHFDCHILNETTCYLQQRYIDKPIINENAVFENNRVYCVDILVGCGKISLNECVNFYLYRRNLNASYDLKLKASRTVYADINKRFSVFPFSLSQITEVHGSKARIALKECLNNQLIDSICPMICEDLATHFMCLIMIIDNQIYCLNDEFAFPDLDVTFQKSPMQSNLSVIRKARKNAIPASELD